MSSKGNGQSGRKRIARADAEPTVRLFDIGQKVFQRFTLQKILGRGGMGIVWLAFDEELERNVALKFLPDVVFHDRAVLDDLKRETRRSLELTHPNIVRIHDFVQDSQSACISMEYVDGEDLSALRQRKSNRVFESPDLEPLMEQWAEAMEYAHRQARVVHCDLKPANLMLSSRGVLKVADFGIARSLNDSVTRLTLGPRHSGTLVYMSPQQLDGEKPSPLDDIYSMGATLYELLTSKPPFYRGQVDAQIREKNPPAVSYRRAELDIDSAFVVPKPWEETIAACLAKDSSTRPQSALEVVRRLTLKDQEAATAINSKSASLSVKGKSSLLSRAAADRPKPGIKSYFPNEFGYLRRSAGTIKEKLLASPRLLFCVCATVVVITTISLAYLLSSRDDSLVSNETQRTATVNASPTATTSSIPRTSDNGNTLKPELSPAATASSSLQTFVGTPSPASSLLAHETPFPGAVSRAPESPPPYRLVDRQLSPSRKMWIEFREFLTAPTNRIYLVPIGDSAAAKSIFSYDSGKAEILFAPDEHALVINQRGGHIAGVHLLLQTSSDGGQYKNRFDIGERIDISAWRFYLKQLGLNENEGREFVAIEATSWEPDSTAVNLRVRLDSAEATDSVVLPFDIRYQLSTGEFKVISDPSVAARAIEQRKTGASQPVGSMYRVSGLPKTAPTLNIREGPGSNYRIVGSFAPNASGIAAEAGRTANGSTMWQEVSGQGHRGWVNSQYLAADQPSKSVENQGQASAQVSTEEQAEVQRMVEVSNNSAKTRDVTQAVSLYADQVDLFDEGIKNREQISADIKKYFLQWPNERMELKGTVVIRRIESDQVEASFTIAFEVRNPSTRKGLRGAANVIWTLKKVNGRTSFQIISHKEKILSRSAFVLPGPNRSSARTTGSPARTSGTPSNGWRTESRY